MPSPFAARDAKLHRAVEKAFGEQFTFKARTYDAADVNLPLVTDPDKADFTVVGIWENLPENEFPRTRSSASDDDVTRHADTYASVAVDPDLCSWTPYKGCRCVRLHDGAIWHVAFGMPDDRGRIVFYLGRKARS